jgi:signal transduction histidine kinase
MSRRDSGAQGASSQAAGDDVVPRALRRFIAGGLLVLLVTSLASVAVARDVARNLALDDARSRGVMFVKVNRNLVNVADLENHRNTRLSRQFRTAMNTRIRAGYIEHIKVWDRSGHVLWADQSQFSGKKIPMEPSVRRLFDADRDLAAISDLNNENDKDLPTGGEPLLEVHVLATSADGVPVVIESNWAADRLDENTDTIMKSIAPLALGGLLLFALLVFPLARSLARRVHQAQQERSQMMQHALSASDLERRRIARDLHDGVMQELSGAGYALSAAAAALPPEAGASRRIMDQLTVVIKDAGASLRSLLTDIYPTSLMQEGLEAAVAELADRTADAGIKVTTDITDLSDVPIEATQLSYRVIREGLHNVRRHAQAEHVEVAATRQGSQVFISVADDGRGPTTPATEEGHLGLRLLTDTLQDLGGTLRLAPRPGGGAVLTATFSLNFASR